MGFKQLRQDFEKQILDEDFRGADIPVRIYQVWILRLLFEIAGNLDSLVVSYRELVALNKERIKKNGA